MTGPTRSKVLAYAVALFMAGAISGAMVTYHRAETSPLTVDRKKEIADHIRERLKTTLQLTDEQAQKIEPDIQKTAAELETSHRDCLNRICGALDNLHTLIAPDLKPEQTEKLNQLTAERRDLMLKKYHYSPESTSPSAH